MERVFEVAFDASRHSHMPTTQRQNHCRGNITPAMYTGVRAAEDNNSSFEHSFTPAEIEVRFLPGKRYLRVHDSMYTGNSIYHLSGWFGVSARNYFQNRLRRKIRPDIYILNLMVNPTRKPKQYSMARICLASSSLHNFKDELLTTWSDKKLLEICYVKSPDSSHATVDH